MSSIDDNAFEDCSSLSAFDIPKQLAFIGNDVFKDCKALSNVNIDLNVEQFAGIVNIWPVSSAVSAKFDSINDDGHTRINFLDVTYMNNGIVKIDNEFIKTRPYISDGKPRTALCALEYELFYAAP